MIITITDDFDPDKIADSGQCFRWEKKDDSTYRIIAGESCLYLTEEGSGRYELSCTEDEYRDFWQNYFDLQNNYRHIRERIDPKEDPFLWRAAEREKGIRILRQDPWEMLITFIISQNKNIPAIKQSVEMLAKRCGKKMTDSRGAEYYAFPEPDAVAALSEHELLDCKLGYRWKYVHAAAEAVSNGNIDLDSLLAADEDSTLTALTGLFGVGVKVASCVSLFGLHHTDAFPVDVWMKRVLKEQYPKGYPYEKYAPYNGICQQFMFAYYRHLNNQPVAEYLPQEFSVCKVKNYSGIDMEQPFVFTGCTDEEKSLVCPAGIVPKNTTSREDGWRAFRICGELDFSLIGILAGISQAMAAAGIGIFAISTYNTDYVLVKEKDFKKAKKTFADAGYRVVKKQEKQGKKEE